MAIPCKSTIRHLLVELTGITVVANFRIDWLLPQLIGNERPADVEATLIALTAQSVANAVQRWYGTPQEVFACGGGIHNNARR